MCTLIMRLVLRSVFTMFKINTPEKRYKFFFRPSFQEVVFYFIVFFLRFFHSKSSIAHCVQGQLTAEKKRCLRIQLINLFDATLTPRPEKRNIFQEYTPALS